MTVLESYTLLQNMLEENELVSKLSTSITFMEIGNHQLKEKQCKLINVVLYIAMKQ